MSDHNCTLVPLGAWCYNSPDVKRLGRDIDIGLFAEALVYYENIYLNVETQPHLAAFLQWFINQGKFADLCALFRDKTIVLYDYSFYSVAVRRPDQAYDIINIQDELQAIPGTFEKRFLQHRDVQGILPHARHRKQLINSLKDSVIEVKAAEFGTAIRNATDDFQNERKNSLIIQVYLDDMHECFGLGDAPKVETRIIKRGPQTQIKLNIDLTPFFKISGKNLNFNLSTPLTAAAQCNRLIWSSATQDCDLFVGAPMGVLIGDKLFESGYKTHKVKDMVETWITEVNFPDIRNLVNSGELSIEDVLLFREKAKPLRRWLRRESERDRDAIVAYHAEVAKEAGWIGKTRKVLSIVGPMVGAAAGGAVGAKMGDIQPAITGAAGAVAGKGAEFLFDIAGKMLKGWSPIIFGKWNQQKIIKYLEIDETR